MSNDTQVLDRNPISPPVSGNQVQPQMGSLNKEVPLATGLSELRPSGPEINHKLDQELKELGVEERNDKPDLTFEHQEIGVKYAGSNVVVQASTPSKVTLPMSDEEIERIMKTGQNDDSGKWLARLIKKIITWGFKAR